jgi:hypothetical protein
MGSQTKIARKQDPAANKIESSDNAKQCVTN